MALEGLAERRTSYASGCISARGRPAPSRPTASRWQRVWLWRPRCVAEPASGPPPGVRLQRRGGGERRLRKGSTGLPAMPRAGQQSSRESAPGHWGVDETARSVVGVTHAAANAHLMRAWSCSRR